MADESCGDGGMCCKLLAIAEIEKPAGRWCASFKRRCGFTIVASDLETPAIP